MKKQSREQSVGAQMFIAVQLMKRAHNKSLIKLESKVTLEQLGILEILLLQGDMNMSELSKVVFKQNANITRIVDKLEKRKFVLRKPVIGDRRVNLLAITKEGQKVFKESIQIVRKTNRDNLSCLSSEEESLMLSLSKRIVSHLS